jgi:predicted nucleic acid-binding Zn ribbon protein
MAKRPLMHSLSQVLEKVLKNLDLEKALIQADIFKHWEAVVGPSVAVHAYPEQVRSDKLYVSVDTSVWLQELTLLKPSLIEKLNAVLGDKVIRDMVLRLDYHAAPNSQQHKTRPI